MESVYRNRYYEGEVHLVDYDSLLGNLRKNSIGEPEQIEGGQLFTLRGDDGTVSVKTVSNMVYVTSQSSTLLVPRRVSNSIKGLGLVKREERNSQDRNEVFGEGLFSVPSTRARLE